MKITVASTDEHLEQILALQRRYHLNAVSAEVQSAEGFVFAQHTLPLLRRMSAQSPQVIAVADDRVVGYCLSLHPSLKHEVKGLVPMFEQFGKILYRGKPVSRYRIIAGGQVCVDRSHRGKGLLARLYEQLRGSSGGAYDLCVTEIASRNQVSLRAHARMGFEGVSTYTDSAEEWVIVAWDLSRAAIIPA